MGDWIKENKFEAALLAAVLAAAGIAYYLSGRWDERYEIAAGEHEGAQRSLVRYQRLAPAPTLRREQAFEDELADYRGTVEKLHKELASFRPKEFERIEPAEFTNRLNASHQRLTELYEARGIAFPEDEWRLGFEPYIASPPRDEATAYLEYQLEALTWLFEKLAAAGPSALLNVRRPPLPVEEGRPMDPEPEEPRSARERRELRRSPPPPADPFYKLPVEVTFRGAEPAVRRFLNTLANAKAPAEDEGGGYFFAMRSIRIRNEKFEQPPKKDDVRFEKPKSAPGGAPGGGFDFGGLFETETETEEEAPGGGEPADGGGEGAPDEGGPGPAFFPPPPAEGAGEAGEEAGGERILGQVLGAEKLDVFLQLELLLFRTDESLPEIR